MSADHSTADIRGNKDLIVKSQAMLATNAAAALDANHGLLMRSNDLLKANNDLLTKNAVAVGAL